VKKIALVFLLAVFVPSLVLAWLAMRSLRDQQLVLERQQSLLCQGVADSLAKEANDFMVGSQQEFGRQVETLLAAPGSNNLITTFDERLRKTWPLAQIGFVVTVSGNLTCPQPSSSPLAREFYSENSKFLCNIQTAQVYLNNSKSVVNGFNQQDLLASNANSNSGQQYRNVTPQQQAVAVPGENNIQQLSKVAPSEAEFRQLVGDSNEGTIARFLENKLRILLWYRSRGDPRLIFGAQLSLPEIIAALKPVVGHLDSSLQNEIAVALLDDTAHPVAISPPGFHANWKHPFVATELGESLPHWELAVYLLDPSHVNESARTLKCALGLLIAILLVVISLGGWLIVVDLNRQLILARQKTDFVSNVSHELKTPLTSIRMFSELLAENRVTDPDKRQSYLRIITAETSRLTRLINNVLDFSRLERGEKKYQFQPCDLAALVRETLDTYRPHLETNGFQIRSQLPETPLMIQGDRDALAQIVVNLLSNAEKYSDARKEIDVQIAVIHEPLPQVEIRVLDRGSGVPGGCAEKIFEQFYRAHDSLASGIPGSGLGLTIARRIARAHGGDVLYRARDGGGSCFILRLPLPNEITA
jgi:signal transduction histidine kinase